LPKKALLSLHVPEMRATFGAPTVIEIPQRLSGRPG
jgi:hypothetical protein